MDKERLERIKKIFLGQVYDIHQIVIFERDDIDWLISTVENQQAIINHLGRTASKLNEYLQGKVKGEWGNNVADVAIRLMEKQQKEIERTKSTWYENYCQQKDMTERAQRENARLREVLEFYANPLNHLMGSKPAVRKDCGRMASKALEGSK